MNKNSCLIMKRFIFFCMCTFITSCIYGHKVDSYQASYAELDQMLTGRETVNLKRAIFTVENAFWDGNLNYQNFEYKLQQYVSFIKSLSVNKLISYNHADFHSVNIHATIF